MYQSLSYKNHQLSTSLVPSITLTPHTPTPMWDFFFFKEILIVHVISSINLHGSSWTQPLTLQTVSSLRKQLRPWHTPAFEDGDPVTQLSVLAWVSHALGQKAVVRNKSVPQLMDSFV